MAVKGIKVSLIASREDGENIPHDAFVGTLGIRDSDPIVETVSDQGRWRAARVTFFVLDISSYTGSKEPHERFHSDINSSFSRLAAWLNGLSTGPFDEARQSGLSVFLLIDLFIDQDQMELSMPSDLSLALARKDLEIRLITND